MSKSSFSRSLLLELTVILAIFLTVWANDGIMKPSVQLETSSTVVSPGSAVNLTCMVVPSPSVIRWKFNGETLDVNNSFGFIVNGSKLHVPSLPRNKGDQNSFQCMVTNSFGTLISTMVNISKAVLKKFEEQDDVHLNVSEGSNCVLPCPLPYSQPKAHIMYRHNNSIIIDKDTDHYRLLPSGNLQILQVRPADQGQYQCMAVNTVQNRTRVANFVIHLHIVKTEVPSQEPKTSMPAEELKAHVGENVVLECSAVGNPHPVITWEKYGGELVPSRYRQQYGNLYLENVTAEDAGTYLCKAGNGVNGLMWDAVKVMMLDIIEPPKVSSSNTSINVSLGGYAELECQITGKPKITWYQNGNLLPAFTGEKKFLIRKAAASDSGYFQCFAENEAGSNYATLVVFVDVTKQDTGSFTLSDQTITKKPSKDKGDDDRSSGPWPRRHRKRKKGRKKEKRPRNGRGHKPLTKAALMVPPSKPEVQQLSDNSVRLNWTVEENDGLQITFFRVQYKKVYPKKGGWKTLDIEIGSHLRIFEVKGLKPRATYRFRIAAVYSNNDNNHGPNSDKFEMQEDPEPPGKPPGKQPTIVEIKPLHFDESYALNIKWKHNVVSSQPIDGFFIYYKPFHAEVEFERRPLLSSSVRAYLLQGLQPGTEYLIKMQSFNSAGQSPFSNEVVERTLGPGTTKHPIPPPGKIVTSTKPPDPLPKDDKKQNNSNEILYMVLGIVVGVMMLFLIVFMFMCWWKQRQQRRMMDAALNDAVRNKFQDPSQRMYSDSLRKKMVNGGLNGVNGTIANGHIPRNYHKMNINVNPLSELESSMEGSNHFSPTSFHPNGSLPGHQRASDNNSNNINQSKSLQNSLQHLNHNNTVTSVDEDSYRTGELVHCSPHLLHNSVPSGHNSTDTQDRHSNRSCDPGSCDPYDSTLSYEDTGGVHSGRHRKRRRRTHGKEQTTKDQATNTDLSSNDGTMELAESNKAISSSQESDKITDNNETFVSRKETHNHVTHAV